MSGRLRAARARFDDRSLVRRRVRRRGRGVRLPGDRRVVAHHAPEPRRRAQGPPVRVRHRHVRRHLGPLRLSFYIYALLFVAFDIEVVFIYLWAIVFRDLLLGGFVAMLVFVGDPARRPRVRLAQGRPDVAMTDGALDPVAAAAARATTPTALRARPARPPTWSSRSWSPTRCGPRPTRAAYGPGTTGLNADIEHLREVEASGILSRDNARWSGALEIVPTKADYILDLIRANSLWPLLSGPRLLRDRDDVDRDQPQRHGPLGDVPVPRQPPPGGRPHRRRHAHDEDGGAAPPPLGGDAGAQVVRRDGRLHLLGRPVQAELLHGPGHRPDHAGGRVHPRLPAAARGADLRDDEAPEARRGPPRPLAGARGRPHGARRAWSRWTAPSAPASSAASAKAHRARPPAPRRDRDPHRAPADVPEVAAARSTTSPTSRFELARRPRAAWTPATTMQVVYHLWSATTADWLRVIVDGLDREDAARAVRHLHLEGRGVDGARGVRHVRHRLRGEPGPPPHLHAAAATRASRSARTSTSRTTRPGRPAGASGRWRRRSPRGRDARHRRPPVGSRARMSARPDARTRTPSLDDPRSSLDRGRRARVDRRRRTRRADRARGRVLHARATARCSSTWGRSTRPPTACCASSSSSTASSIVDVDPVLGYLHRGVEKLCENADYHQAICYTDPLEYVARSSASGRRSWRSRSSWTCRSRAAPSTSGCSPASCNRIASHALFMGWFALDLGGITPILYGFIERDEIMEMLAALTGQKLLFNYMRIGGVNGDLNHEFMSRLGDWMSRAGEADRGEHRPPQRERDLRPPGARPRRPRPGDGAPDGASPARTSARSGVPFDVRRAHPYSVYPELDFDIPTRAGGRLRSPATSSASTRSSRSLRIIDQCLHQMPDGPVMARLPRLIRPRPGRACAAVEGPRGMYAAYAISRRHGPAVPHADPRPELRPPPARRAHDPGQPHRRHDGDHGEPRPGHGRSRQVGHAMSVVGASWQRLGPGGRILAILIPVLVVVGVVGRPRRPLRRPHRFSSSSGDNLPIVRFVARGRRRPPPLDPDRLHHHLHGAEGHRPDEPPGRAPTGSGRSARAMSVVHGLKVLSKEDFTPTGVDVTVFTLAPVVDVPRDDHDVARACRSRRASSART